MLETLFKDLAWECVKNDLQFNYLPLDDGTEVISIYKIVDDEHVLHLNESYNGWNLHHDRKPEDTLVNLHQQVLDYIEKQYIETLEDEEFTSPLTECERGMKLSGHKESDFYE